MDIQAGTRPNPKEEDMLTMLGMKWRINLKIANKP